MNRNFLLPNKWKMWGWVLLISCILGDLVLKNYFPQFELHLPFATWESTFSTFETVNGVTKVLEQHSTTELSNVIPTIYHSLIYLSMVMILFSRNKNEDEYITKIRLDALAWAVIINSFLLIIFSTAFWFDSFYIVLYGNLYSLLIIAIIRFYYLYFKTKSMSNYENNALNRINKKERFLISNEWRKWGWLLFLLSLGLHIIDSFYQMYLMIMIPYLTETMKIDTIGNNFSYYYFAWEIRNVLPTLFIICGLIGLLLIAFSREREEDELISQYRLNSLAWAVIINYALLIVMEWIIWGPLYLDVIPYAMFTPMIFFIIRFNYLKYKMRKSLANEIMEGEAL